MSQENVETVRGLWQAFQAGWSAVTPVHGSIWKWWLTTFESVMQGGLDG
jgi:hypothetical protein